MLQKFLRAVPKEAPTFYLWRTYAMVSINAWFWSSVFHTRDFPFTEKMDYFCALAAVLFSFYAFLIRLIGYDRTWKWTAPALPLLIFYTYHCYYLTFVRFDYGYNMVANVSVGVLNSIGWLVFCAVRREGRSWKELMPCAVSVLMVDCLMVLELLDFPPLFFTFDAHSLWHLGTAPIAFLWYRFLIEDSLHVHRQERKTGKFL
ncbi:hypothetical protein RvY_16910 [Ramazzottius varieornatus]|uniref:Post-GPI attachment to proteins factor 3 n=1 Tax=Ramazzottius varieornatus TaxID=947166 RepID=A0A1D1W073_RAMVA|nr:hypothetical protein RvY_16910 [Ramazzottius varieornatus]